MTRVTGGIMVASIVSLGIISRDEKPSDFSDFSEFFSDFQRYDFFDLASKEG